MIEIQEVLFDAQTIERRVAELAGRISRDYADKELVVVCILKGAFTFTADLMRRLTIPVELDFVRAASYGTSTKAGAEIVIANDIETDIRDRHVLLVDGIIDRGGTMACLRGRYGARGPASLRAVVLLSKRARRTVDVPVEYVGYEIPDRFVAGYGMDCAGRHRNLPFIAAVKTEQD